MNKWFVFVIVALLGVLIGFKYFTKHKEAEKTDQSLEPALEMVGVALPSDAAGYAQNRTSGSEESASEFGRKSKAPDVVLSVLSAQEKKEYERRKEQQQIDRIKAEKAYAAQLRALAKKKSKP